MAISILTTERYATQRTSLLYVILCIILISRILMARRMQGYKYYQHRKIAPLFAFGYFHFVLMIGHERLKFL